MIPVLEDFIETRWKEVDWKAGHGLAKIGGALVPFQNRLPKDTQLYKLMTTKFGE